MSALVIARSSTTSRDVDAAAGSLRRVYCTLYCCRWQPAWSTATFTRKLSDTLSRPPVSVRLSLLYYTLCWVLHWFTPFLHRTVVGGAVCVRRNHVACRCDNHAPPFFIPEAGRGARLIRWSVCAVLRVSVEGHGFCCWEFNCWSPGEEVLHSRQLSTPLHAYKPVVAVCKLMYRKHVALSKCMEYRCIRGAVNSTWR